MRCHSPYFYPPKHAVRNKVVFENHKSDWNLESRQTKMRWGFWLKTWMENENAMVDEICASPSTLRKWRWQLKG